MNRARPTARVVGLATTPVKGLRIQPRDAVMLERTGASGNRAFYLIDEDDRMVNGKQIGPLSAVVADYDEHARTLEMTFPDGELVSGVVTPGDWIDTRFLSRGKRGRLVVGPWSSALSDHAGRGLRLVQADGDGKAVDRGLGGTVSLISRASIAKLEGIAGAAVDSRRFRMLIEVEGPTEHQEDQWVGGEVRIGEATVSMNGHVGRCVVTSQDPETGIADMPTLDLLRSYRSGLETTAPLAFGIFGEVVAPGQVRLGDEVHPI